MATNLNEPETLDRSDRANEQAVVDYLRAHGVQPATQPWGGPYTLAKPRPRWLAFVVRTLRTLRLLDD
jgi:hypothetical protein